MATMIHLINVTKAFGAQVLYDDISFSINPREKIGLVGANGHGKTTLFGLDRARVLPAIPARSPCPGNTASATWNST